MTTRKTLLEKFEKKNHVMGFGGFCKMDISRLQMKHHEIPETQSLPLAKFLEALNKQKIIDRVSVPVC